MAESQKAEDTQRSVTPGKSFARILKAHSHSHSMSGGSIIVRQSRRHVFWNVLASGLSMVQPKLLLSVNAVFE
jgi:hypothetical protein